MRSLASYGKKRKSTTPPCQGGGRGFDPRLALFLFLVKYNG